MKAGDFISESKAIKMVHDYRRVMKKLPEDEVRETHAVLYDKSFLNELLERKDAAGIKFYFAMGEDKRPTLVLIPTNDEGEDLEIIEEFPHSNRSAHKHAAPAGPIILTVGAGQPGKGPGGVANQGQQYP